MSSKITIDRQLKINLPKGQSAFLWGPRQVGKSTLIKQRYPNHLIYNLLESDLFLQLSKEPFRLRQELAQFPSKDLRLPIIIDEVQKIPSLLDEVHWLIENKELSFLLCGSSARKLKQTHANMLGGRAWRFELFPLTSHELREKFDLLTALNRGLIPSHYFSKHYQRDHRAYITNYLKEEIQQEGLIRNLPAFARFLDVIPFVNGELINYTNIGRDCAIDNKTVAAYFQILIDTLIGYYLEPYHKKINRQLISATPKFYLFDVGIANGIAKRTIQQNQGEEFGRSLEHFILMEIKAYNSYFEKDAKLNFWRTSTGLEVDFVINGGSCAIEVKSSKNIRKQDLSGLKAFIEDYQPKRAILVCQESRKRIINDAIEVMPISFFLKELWGGHIF